LVAHQELGAGFYIAKADLEIRGAGNLLGSQQSGHATSIGLELYTEMLHAEVQRQQGEPITTELDPEIKLSISALIPKTFITSETERLTLYQKLFSIQAVDDLTTITHGVEDRHGKAPLPFLCLLQVATIRFWLKQHKIQTLWQEGQKVFGRRTSPDSQESFLLYEGSTQDHFLEKVIEKLSSL
jgi:transcription-repair coupling factor (superfamily II helicase)